jgi:multicomponent Na+:H+ antiporter subunit E
MSGAIDVSRRARPRRMRGLATRTLVFFVFWLILSGGGLVDLSVGVLAAIVAAWVSLRLLPAGSYGFHPVAVAQLVLRFLYQSVGAGIDVAGRALHPRLPLQPGFVIYRPHLPPGPMRDGFCTMTSLLPGTLPCGPDEEGNLIIHCLDMAQPVPDQMATEEAAFVRALGST